MFPNLSYQNYGRKTFVALSGSAIINATLTFVMVSLPFLLLTMNLTFAYMGILEAIGLLTNFAARVPAKVFAERYGSEAGISSGLSAMGISMGLLYLSINLSLIIASIFLINVSFTFFHSGIRPKLSVKPLSKTDEKKPSAYGVFNAGGPLIALVIAGFYGGADIRPLYGAISLILLFTGVFSLFVLNFHKPLKSNPPLTERLVELIRRPFLALNEMERISEKDFITALAVIQIVTVLSVGSVLVFMPAMAIRDGLTRSEVFFLFAVIGIASFLLKYLGKLYLTGSLGRLSFLIRPFFLLLSFLLLSLGYYPLLFQIGYSITAIWYFLEPGSDIFVKQRFEDGNPERLVYLSSLFSRPLAVIAPILGALLWLLSPRLLFAVAIFPVLVAFILANLMISKPEALRIFRQQNS